MEPTGPPPPPTTDHTEWVWDSELGEWVDQEKEQVPVEVPPRPDDTATHTWELGPDGWVQRPWTVEELAQEAALREREAGRLALKAVLVDMRAEKDRARLVLENTNATGRERDLARSVLRICDAIIDLTRALA